MYSKRKGLYKRLSKQRGSLLLTYVTGDRPGLETQIASDVLELLGNLLDAYEGAKKISLLLYTRGGDTLAAWGIANLIREFCDEVEVIVPSKCHSAGTLICLSADCIVMSKQATLGPIDPSTNGPLNPQIPARPNMRMAISVEDTAGFLEMAKSAGVSSEEGLREVFLKLADHVHPVSLGQVQRARSQIKELAKKLLQKHSGDQQKIKKIVDLLCVEAGSHDYLIYRTEARKTLALNIETPSMDLYKLMREIYIDIRQELELDKLYNPAEGLAPNSSKKYKVVRALAESQESGAYQFIKEGELTHTIDATGNSVINDIVSFEGWRFVK